MITVNYGDKVIEQFQLYAVGITGGFDLPILYSSCTASFAVPAKTSPLKNRAPIKLRANAG